MSILPIGLRADQVTVLVVGAGRVGTRKALVFLAAGARVRVVDPSPADEIVGHAGQRLEIVAREFVDDDVRDADLVVAATGDARVDARVVAAARSHRRLVNSADEPAEGTFDTLAVHRSGALAIGVSAGGVPQAAGRIRDQIAARFGPRYGAALDTLARVRSARLATGEWPRVAASLLADDFCRTVERGTFEEKAAEWV